MIDKREERKNVKVKKGFTITEATLSMIFVGTLFLSVLFIIIQITTMYEKGLTLKSVNATGRSLVDELTRSISSSRMVNLDTICDNSFRGTARTTCKTQMATQNTPVFLYQQNYKDDVIINGVKKRVPVNGVFCSGSYSYIWNTGYANTSAYKNQNNKDYRLNIKYRNKNGTVIPNYNTFRLLKVRDDSRNICMNRVKGSTISGTNKTEGSSYITSNFGTIDISDKSLKEDPEELLSETGDQLVIYDFRMFKPSQSAASKQSFMSGTFTLGTLKGTVDINASGDHCTEMPDNLNTDFAYCAMNKFNFSAWASGVTK